MSINHNLGPGRARGFTLFELAIAVSIIAILAGALLNRIIFYMEQAELTAMQQVVGTLRSAMHLKVSQLYVSGRMGELATMVDENPMDWLAETPSNYVGEYYVTSINEVAPGNWYFDRRQKKLVYLLNHGKNFSDPTLNVLKFKVKLSSVVGKQPSGTASVDGVTLAQVSE